ncbi:hypothetical protein OHA40_30300 [Nocardia sp. NBC_00508]|uniref:hypothetical protein n=1 Tax=Nocardia sp. NBC_00508 TaxID=2975992 RepID=UPI002E80B438|nr:hypothetical protein [Nocardia sp. NBC_00508]WUD65846.1 hypothetical protein OHA40_30300 [Nocardia sp. NBC_00508]
MAGGGGKRVHPRRHDNDLRGQVLAPRLGGEHLRNMRIGPVMLNGQALDAEFHCHVALRGLRPLDG